MCFLGNINTHKRPREGGKPCFNHFNSVFCERLLIHSRVAGMPRWWLPPLSSWPTWGEEFYLKFLRSGAPNSSAWHRHPNLGLKKCTCFWCECSQNRLLEKYGNRVSRSECSWSLFPVLQSICLGEREQSPSVICWLFMLLRESLVFHLINVSLWILSKWVGSYLLCFYITVAILRFWWRQHESKLCGFSLTRFSFPEWIIHAVNK